MFFYFKLILGKTESLSALSAGVSFKESVLTGGDGRTNSLRRCWTLASLFNALVNTQPTKTCVPEMKNIKED